MSVNLRLHLYSKSILVAFALLLLVTPSQTRAWSGSDLPSFDEFVERVTNGKSDELRGMYVPGALADEIVTQPNGEPTFISSHANTLTVFGMATKYGSTGLLAHNTLAGQDFSLLKQGQVIYLIYGDGRFEPFIITEFMRYQALRPQSITSDFVDLESGESLPASKLFLNVFDRPGDVILQTCIYADGDNSWGRLFIIAKPYEDTYYLSMPNVMGIQKQ